MAAVIGIIGGVASGLFGVGGGVVMVPAMTLLLASHIGTINVATGTSLAVIVPTAIIGTWKHHSQGTVKWDVVIALIPAAMVGGYIGASLNSKTSAPDLTRMFGGFLVLVGCKLLFFK